MSKVVQVSTKDNVDIAGDFYEYEGAKKGVLLLHMMPATRSSWKAFADTLQTAGFAVLAIDLRGHGESQGGPDGYKDFSDAEHAASRADVERAADFLREQGVSELHIAGASIGANLALQYASEHQETRSVILLSPGLVYRGVATAPALAALAPDQGVMLAASEDDAYSFESVGTLAQTLSFDEAHQLRTFANAGHGTTMFEHEQEFMDELVMWLGRN